MGQGHGVDRLIRSRSPSPQCAHPLSSTSASDVEAKTGPSASSSARSSTWL